MLLLLLNRPLLLLRLRLCRQCLLLLLRPSAGSGAAATSPTDPRGRFGTCCLLLSPDISGGGGRGHSHPGGGYGGGVGTNAGRNVFCAPQCRETLGSIRPPYQASSRCIVCQFQGPLGRAVLSKFWLKFPPTAKLCMLIGRTVLSKFCRFEPILDQKWLQRVSKLLLAPNDYCRKIALPGLVPSGC